MTITIEKHGRRYYVAGNTYAIKDQLKEQGFKWDGERRAWYTGKKDVAESLDGTDMSSSESGEDSGRSADEQVVAGRAEYKGRTYYLAGRRIRANSRYERDGVDLISTRDGAKLLLVFRDGSKTFWAARGEVTIGKTYQSPQTIGGLRDFAAREKRADEQGEARCAECGGRGHLIPDLEDGMLKHRNCCDIPS